MELLDRLLKLPIFQNSLEHWLVAIGVITALLAALITARRFIRRYHERLLKTDRTELIEVPVEVLGRTTVPFFIVLSVFAGLGTLEMSAGTNGVLNTALTIALFWQAGVWVIRRSKWCRSRSTSRSSWETS